MFPLFQIVHVPKVDIDLKLIQSSIDLLTNFQFAALSSCQTYSR